MYCAQCGAQITPNSQFCPACGAKAGGSAPTNVSVVQSAVQRDSSSGSPRKLATWKKVLLGIIGFIVLVVGLGFWATGDLQAVADNHLAALRNGDIQRAFSQTSPDFQQATPMAAYQKFVESYPVLTGHKDFSMQERGFKDNSGYVRGHLTDGEKPLAKIEFTLVKLNDHWMIQGISLKAPDAQ